MDPIGEERAQPQHSDISFEPTRSMDSQADSFIDGWGVEYMRLAETLWDQCLRLGAETVVLGKIMRFPWRALPLVREGPFINTVVEALARSAAIRICALVGKSRRGRGLPINLFQFKNEVARYLKPEPRSAYLARVRQASLTPSQYDVLRRLDTIRDGLIAHLDIGLLAGRPGSPPSRVTLEEFEELATAMKKLFEATSVGAHWCTDHIDYRKREAPPTVDLRSDIDIFLDNYASRHAHLSLPEENPAVWNEIARSLTPADLERYNAYRRKSEKNPLPPPEGASSQAPC